MISMTDIAWAVGFMEGEAYFDVRGHSPSIKVAQVNPEPLYKLKSIFGGHINFFKRKDPNTPRKDYYYWQIGGSPCAAIMMTIYDWLSVARRIKVHKCITEWKIGRVVNGARGSIHCAKGHEYTPENTYRRPGGKQPGRRQCKQCRNEYQRTYIRKGR